MKHTMLAAALGVAFAVPCSAQTIADGTYQFVTGANGAPGNTYGTPSFAVSNSGSTITGIPNSPGARVGTHAVGCSGSHVHGTFNGFADPAGGGCGHGIVSILNSQPGAANSLPGSFPNSAAGTLALTRSGKDSFIETSFGTPENSEEPRVFRARDSSTAPTVPKGSFVEVTWEMPDTLDDFRMRLAGFGAPLDRDPTFDILDPTFDSKEPLFTLEDRWESIRAFQDGLSAGFRVSFGGEPNPPVTPATPSAGVLADGSGKPPAPPPAANPPAGEPAPAPSILDSLQEPTPAEIRAIEAAREAKRLAAAAALTAAEKAADADAQREVDRIFSGNAEESDRAKQLMPFRPKAFRDRVERKIFERMQRIINGTLQASTSAAVGAPRVVN